MRLLCYLVPAEPSETTKKIPTRHVRLPRHFQMGLLSTGVCGCVLTQQQLKSTLSFCDFKSLESLQVVHCRRLDTKLRHSFIACSRPKWHVATDWAWGFSMRQPFPYLNSIHIQFRSKSYATLRYAQSSVGGQYCVSLY
jgi:hypothetical protein